MTAATYKRMMRLAVDDLNRDVGFIEGARNAWQAIQFARSLEENLHHLLHEFQVLIAEIRSFQNNFIQRRARTEMYRFYAMRGVLLYNIRRTFATHGMRIVRSITPRRDLALARAKESYENFEKQFAHSCAQGGKQFEKQLWRCRLAWRYVDEAKHLDDEINRWNDEVFTLEDNLRQKEEEVLDLRDGVALIRHRFGRR